MYRDFKELLSVLNAHRVKYLIVGGYAVSLHAEPRATKDLDVLIGPGAENGKAVFAALAEFGAPLEGLTPEDFVEPGNFFRMGSPPVMVDILSRISGVDFGQAWEHRVEFPVDFGLNALFISREDLLAAKLAAGRPQDLADAEALGEHLTPVEHRSPETAARPSASDMETARRQAVTDWLAYRAQQQAAHGSITLEERRAKAVKDWKKLQKQKANAEDVRASGRAQQKEQSKDEGKEAAEDPEI